MLSNTNSFNSSNIIKIKTKVDEYDNKIFKVSDSEQKVFMNINPIKENNKIDVVKEGLSNVTKISNEIIEDDPIKNKSETNFDLFNDILSNKIIKDEELKTFIFKYTL